MKLDSSQIKELREKFSSIKSKEDLVDVLNVANRHLKGDKCKEITLRKLNYYSNPSFCQKRYKTFEIAKKSGGKRVINAPVYGCKTILRSLNLILNCIYEPSEKATGFVPGKSIVDNAKLHTNKNYVYNIDLKDFFHSFDRNRVKIGFMYKPFNLNGEKEKIAFLLASLCTHPFEIEGEERVVLPQGSPTSPTITNILCSKLDRRLGGLAKRFGLEYSRYADDITFSSLHNVFKDADFQSELMRIIEEDQDLKLNEKKSRLQKRGYKQEVTGLIVNNQVNVARRYVKQIRMWLYYWERYGYDRANEIFLGDYMSDRGHVKNLNAKLNNVLDGKLHFLKMVKGESDSTYIKLNKRFGKLSKSNSLRESRVKKIDDVVGVILTKGLKQGLKLYD